MANYATLKAAIAAAIKENGNEEITGNLLQQSLLAMVNSLGVGYQYIGIATTDTNPGTPDQNVFYLASTAGVYANFGGLVLADGEISILKYNGAWSKDSTGAATLEKVNQLDQENKLDNTKLSYPFPVVAGGANTIIIDGVFPAGIYGISILPLETGNAGGFGIYITPANYVGVPSNCVFGVERTLIFTNTVNKIQLGDITGITTSGEMSVVIRRMDSQENQLNYCIAVGKDFSSKLFGPWMNGTLASGLYNTYRAQYRICMAEFGRFERSIKITAKDGYKFLVALYDENKTFISDTGAWVKSYTVPENQYFKLMVTTDNDNVNLSVDDGVANINISTLLDTEIDKLTNAIDWNDILLTGTVSPISSGWEYSTYLAANRVCVNPNKPLVLKAGSIFHVPDGYKIFILYRANGVYYNPGVWISGDFVCPIDGEYVFTYSKNPESAFTEPTNAEKVSSLSLISKGAFATNDNLLRLSEQNANLIAKKNNIISVARLGYMPYSASTPPEQSIESYVEAYKYGYRYMLADVRWTSDNVPVCLHDETINAVARNTDGSVISTDIRLDSLTLAQVDEYDFGIIKGSQYAGQKIMRLAEFIRWCKIMNCVPILEVKDVVGNGDTAKKDSLVEILKQYRMERDVIFDADAGYITSQSLHALFPYAAMGRTVVRTTDFTGGILTETLNVKGEHNRVIWFLWLGNSSMVGAVSETMLNVAYENDIDIYLTEVPDYARFQSFITDENNLAAKYVAITGGTWDEYMNAMNL